MANSQNGWPVVSASSVTDYPILGVEFPNGWLKGDVDTVFAYLILRLHREVEPMQNPGCWGWYVKDIEGSTQISNHSSGTAIDYNAPNHPMGVRNTYSAEQEIKIYAILDDLKGIVRWGGNYTGRADEMHFEINANANDVHAVATKLGRDMFLIHKGDKGEEVKFWQNVLTFIGYPVTVDGDYGSQTEAAINKYRKDVSGAAPITYLTGWQAWSMLGAMIDKHSGKPGKNGLNGKDGKDGKDGTLTGVLAVTGGTLHVETPSA